MCGVPYLKGPSPISITVSRNFSSESAKSLASSLESKVVLLQNLIAMEFPNVLACTDLGPLDILLTSRVMDEFVSKREERGPLVRSNASRMRDLQIKSSTVDLAILFYQSKDVGIFPLLVEIFRMLKPGATLAVRRGPMFNFMKPDQLVTDQMISALEAKLSLAGFEDIQRSQSIAPYDSSILSGFNAKKPSWKIRSSSLALKKVVKSSPKVQIDVDSDLVDEDSLLTEDRNKLQLPAVGDCEIGSTCKNCTCVRAEEEEKVLKFGSTAE